MAARPWPRRRSSGPPACRPRPPRNGSTRRPTGSGGSKVEPDLTVPGHPEIFAIGDAAIVARPDGRPVPGIAPAAKQEGAYVAKVIRARLAGRTPPPAFRYKHAGDLATIGKRRAVIDFGWIQLRGALAWWLWGFAHIYFLIGVRNRLSVALNWLWIYARDQRSARLITRAAKGGRGNRDGPIGAAKARAGRIGNLAGSLPVGRPHAFREQGILPVTPC